MKKSMDMYAVVTPGLETVCVAEAETIGLPDVRPGAGGVAFGGGLRELYLANLWLRSATRILVRVGTIRSSDFPELFRKTVRLPWGSFLRPGTAIQVRASSRGSRLVHTGRIGETISAAIDRAMGGGIVSDTGENNQLILARFEDNGCQLSVDSSGALLHRRGYRDKAGPAPLRENLAAALLLALGWRGGKPLYDPCCGSGTIPVEAALLAGNQAPGRAREFAFMAWPGFRPGLWQLLQSEAAGKECSSGVMIQGADVDSAVLAMARENAARAGVDTALRFELMRLEDQPRHSGSGLLLCNPPYGIRLDAAGDPRRFYHVLGEVSRRSFQGWQVAFLAPEERLARATNLPVRLLLQFANGGVPVGLYATRDEKIL